MRACAPTRAIDVPEAKAVLSRWIERSGCANLGQYADSDAARRACAPDGVLPPLIGRLGRNMASAPAYWVEPAMQDLLVAASASLPSPVVACPPSPSGVVFFSRDVPLPDGKGGTDPHDRVAPLRAIQWTDRSLLLLIQHHNTHLMCGLPAALDMDSQSADYRVLRSMLLSFWILVQQRLCVRTAAVLPRSFHRRLQRIPADGAVQIIDLRRTSGPSHPSHASGQTVDWSHRWLVDGHWRNHYMPASGAHRPTWIAPHVKGPPEKPLIVGERVYRWKR